MWDTLDTMVVLVNKEVRVPDLSETVMSKYINLAIVLLLAMALILIPRVKPAEVEPITDIVVAQEVKEPVKSWDDLTRTEKIKKNPNKCNLDTQWMWGDGSCHDKTSSVSKTTPVTPVSGGVEQWRSLVSQYNWNVDTVLRIMACESGGNPNAVGDTTTAYHSYGLMQIRALPGRPSPAWLLVPENNIQEAYKISGGGTNFNPWSCY